MALSKEKTKLLGRLLNPRIRPREGQFIVEGIRGAREAILGADKTDVRFAVISPRLSATEPGGDLEKLIRTSGIPLEEVTDEEMVTVAATDHPQGVLLVVREAPSSLIALGRETDSRILVLDGVQDPGNAGTLIRAARAFGIRGVLALDGTVDLFNPKVVRASAGALFHVPVVRVSWGEFEEWLDGGSLPLYVADAGGEDVSSIQASTGWVLVVGNEGAGPRRGLLERADRLVGIPMRPGVDSLNAGLAGAILLFALNPDHGNPLER